MKKIILSLLFLAVLSGTYSIQSCKSSQASASRLLKFNLEKGKGYDYEMVWDLDQEIMKQDMAISITGGYSVEVADDDGNIKTISAEYNDFKMNMKIMGKEIDVDTQKPVTDTNTEDIKQDPGVLMNKIFRSIIGKKFTMRVDKEGKVLEIIGFDNLFAGMADSLGLDEEAKQKMIQGIKQNLNDEDLKNSFTQVFYIFPQKEVKVGDSWTKDYDKGGKLPAKYSTTYKVKDIEGDMVTLSADSKIESAKENTENMKVEGTQTGTLLVDSRSGLVVNADFTQEITVSVSGMGFIIKGKGKIKGKPRM